MIGPYFFSIWFYIDSRNAPQCWNKNLRIDPNIIFSCSDSSNKYKLGNPLLFRQFQSLFVVYYHHSNQKLTYFQESLNRQDYQRQWLSQNQNDYKWVNVQKFGRCLVEVWLRFDWGLIEVRSKFGRGSVEVRLRFGRGSVEVRSRFGRGSDEVQSRFGQGLDEVQ